MDPYYTYRHVKDRKDRDEWPPRPIAVAHIVRKNKAIQAPKP